MGRPCGTHGIAKLVPGRIRSIAMPAPPLEYRFARYRLRPAQRELLVDDAPVKIGSRAFDTLLALVEQRDRAVAKAELMERVWPRLVVEENNLQVQIATLRKRTSKKELFEYIVSARV